MSDFSLTEINERIVRESAFVDNLKKSLGQVIVGQEDLINRILIGLLANGHILLEGVPGLAKTLTVKTLAQLINTQFQRIQFTPDMLPADLIGTLIFNQKNGSFETRKGPIFANVILADEINRSPAKVQSALLSLTGSTGGQVYAETSCGLSIKRGRAGHTQTNGLNQICR